MSWTKCTAITITLKGTPKDVLESVKKEAKKNDVIITGDDKKGDMKHKTKAVRGTYSVSGQKLTIKMEETLFGPICGVINSEVKKWFAGK
jgi:hypothetical protein